MFRRMETAYSVLRNDKLRSIYDRFGEAGLKVLETKPMDSHRYAMTHLFVYYSSVLIHTFINTASAVDDVFVMGIIMLCGKQTLFMIASLLIVSPIRNHSITAAVYDDATAVVCAETAVAVAVAVVGFF